ncbi:MAG: cupin domain-containing protein [Acidobacteria bacterium]|nr:cupin domain-containing protein [Acidobacteriota bacterium]
MQTTKLPEDVSAVAPDGSEIRFLAGNERASTVHCTLPAGGVSLAVRHLTVEEIWYCLEGRGEVWRRLEGREEVTAFEPGVSLDIPLGAHFQFRNDGDAPLRFLIATMPPWPGADEAVRVEDHWPTAGG